MNRKRGEAESHSERDMGQDIVGMAIREGIGEISRYNPRLRGLEEYFLGNIDSKAIGNEVRKLYGEINEKGLTGQAAVEFLKEGIARTVSEGYVFDKRIRKHITFKRGLEGELRAEGEEEELNRMYRFAEDVEHMIRAGKFDPNQHPEFASKVREAYQAGSFRTMLDMLANANLLNDETYSSIRKSLYQKAKVATEGAIAHLRAYALPPEVVETAGQEKKDNVYRLPQRTEKIPSHAEDKYARATVFIVGFIGIVLIIASGLQLTGATVGVVSSYPSKFWMCGIGLFCIFISYLFFARMRRHSYIRKKFNLGKR